MDRDKYQKRLSSVYQRRKSRQKLENEAGKQRFIFHIMVCGIILIVVLLLTIIDTPFTNRTVERLRTAIETSITAETLKEWKEAGLEKFFQAKDAVEVFVRPEETEQNVTPLKEKTENSDILSSDQQQEQADSVKNNNPPEMPLPEI